MQKPCNAPPDVTTTGKELNPAERPGQLERVRTAERIGAAPNVHWEDPYRAVRCSRSAMGYFGSPCNGRAALLILGRNALDNRVPRWGTGCISGCLRRRCGVKPEGRRISIVLWTQPTRCAIIWCRCRNVETLAKWQGASWAKTFPCCTPRLNRYGLVRPFGFEIAVSGSLEDIEGICQ